MHDEFKDNPRYLTHEEWLLYSGNYSFETYDQFLQHLRERDQIKTKDKFLQLLEGNLKNE